MSAWRGEAATKICADFSLTAEGAEKRRDYFQIRNSATLSDLCGKKRPLMVLKTC
jgi:hypothetical protein